MPDDHEATAIQPGTGEPWPHPWEPQDHCYIHGYEPVIGEPYILCGECHHCYRTADELVLYFWDLVRLANGEQDMELPSGEPVKPDDILFCPLCLHDF